jgi:hypothetical protein
MSKILVRKLEAKGPLRRPRQRYEDNIKTDYTKIDVDWMHLVQDRVQQHAGVNSVMNLQVP